jgi:hypothetical protein
VTFASEPIGLGEVVAAKGGHIVNGATVSALPSMIRNSSFQIADDCFLGALDPSEYEGVMMLVNHSCDRTWAWGVTSSSLRCAPSLFGEELTIDYCLFMGDPEFSMMCQCGRLACRTMITGNDWSSPDLQERHRGWFSWYLARRMVNE